MENLVCRLDLLSSPIIRSRNGPGHPIYREDLPPILYGRAPRIILGSTWFDKYSESTRKQCCEGCHKEGHLERHELYGLYKYGNDYVIKLEGIMWLCHTCHGKIHGGFSTNMRYGTMANPVPVSDAMNTKKYPWNEAKYLLVDRKLYPLN